MTLLPNRVLVVEDDPGIRVLLRGEGYAVETANDGLEGLDRAAASPPDVVILDYAMPRCDGAGFAAQYRLEDQHAPIILLTASDRRQDHCREIHADACIGKPFQIDELLEAVEEHCH